MGHILVKKADEDLAALTDVFYFGGTKCGALFGEAVVLTADSLKKRFKAYMKQNGAVLAKGWLLGLQFHCLLGHDLYFTATRRADELAMKLRKAFAAQGIPFWVESFTNQQFVILNEKQQEVLGQNYTFEKNGSTLSSRSGRWKMDAKSCGSAPAGQRRKRKCRH